MPSPHLMPLIITVVWNTGLPSFSLRCSMVSKTTSLLYFCPHSIILDLKLTSLYASLSILISSPMTCFSVVKIESSYKCFKRIATHIVIMPMVYPTTRLYLVIEPHFLGKPV